MTIYELLRTDKADAVNNDERVGGITHPVNCIFEPNSHTAK